MKRIEFKANVQELLNESLAVLDEKMNALLASGAVDLETADIRTCKAAVRAFLLNEADQFDLCSADRTASHLLDHSVTRKFDSEVSNMRIMM